MPALSYRVCSVHVHIAAIRHNESELHLCRSRGKMADLPVDEWEAIAATESDSQEQQFQEEDGSADDWGAVAASSALAAGDATMAVPSGPLFTSEAAAHPPRKRGRPSSKFSRLQRETLGPPQPLPAPEAPAANRHAPPLRQAPPEPLQPSAVRLPGDACQMKAPKRARMGPIQLLPHMPQILAHALGPDAPKDDALLKLAQLYLDPQHYRLSSQVILQDKLQLPMAVLQMRLIRLASTLFVQQVYERLLLEEKLAEALSPRCLRFYLDVSSYDETPLKVNMQESLATGAATAAADAAVAAAKATSNQGCRSDTLICKLLQTRQAFGLLVDTASGLIAISGEHYSPLQSMSRTTGEVLAQCLARNSAVSHCADQWNLKARSVCCDKAPSNLKGEKLLSQGRGAEWQSTIFQCDIHCLAICHQRAFQDLMPTHITGLVRTALCLRFQHTRALFRESLLEELASRPFRLVVGVCPQEAADHRHRCIQVLIAGVGKDLEDAVLLLAWVNGDWRNETGLEHYWHPSRGAPPGERAARDMFNTAILTALASKRPRCWPQHRWTGFGEAVSDISILHAVHGLLKPTFARLLAKMGELKSTSGGAAAEECVPEEEVVPPTQLEQDMPVMVGLIPVEDAAAAVPADTAPQNLGGQGDPSGARQNAKDRRMAWQWLQGDPFMGLLKMAIALGPLERVRHLHFGVAGQEWEMRQKAKAADLVLRGEASQREYRLQLAAEGLLEQEFQGHLLSTFKDDSRWGLLPTGALSVAERSESFRLLSRIGAAIAQLLAQPHSLYPVKLCPGLGREMAAEPNCLKDDWTLKLQTEYPQLEGAELQAILRVQASHQALDISTIESRHASIRRQVVCKSVQTWRLSLAQLSAEWLIQNFRLSQTAMRKGAKRADLRVHREGPYRYSVLAQERLFCVECSAP